MISSLIIILATNITTYLKYFTKQTTTRQRIVLEKIILCNSKKLGMKMVYCPECNEEKTIYFSCKSSYCPYCGKKANKEFVQKFIERMLPVTHRHLTMTMSSRLWKIFQENPQLQKRLIKTSFTTVEETMYIFSKKRLVPGGLGVIHTYGKDLKTNCHIHLIVTEGGYIKGTKEWESFTYFPFENRGKVWKTINQIWMENVLKLLEEFLPNTSNNKTFINHFREKYKKGFYIYAPTKERIKTNNSKRTKAKYITRYIKHPIISDRRILKYDKNTVTFWYHDQFKRKRIVRMDTLQFMFNVIKHIPPKNFRLVNFYGIYANSSKIVVFTVQTVFNDEGEVVNPKDIPKNKKNRIIRCPDCNTKCLDVYLILYISEVMSYRVLALIPYFILNELSSPFYYRKDIKWENGLTKIITSLHRKFYQPFLLDEYVV